MLNPPPDSPSQLLKDQRSNLRYSFKQSLVNYSFMEKILSNGFKFAHDLS